MLTSVIKGISLLIMYITLAQQVKKSTCNAGNVSLIAGLGRSPGGGNGNSLQYSFFFFKYKFIYFHWRLITLQYCIGFAIHQYESATGIHVFPIPNPPPSSLPVPLLQIQ